VPASAHATLVSSNPTSGSVLDASPAEITLQFDERVDTVPGSIRMVTAAGDEVDIGRAEHRTASELAASLPQLADGTYVVAWKAISADSHPVSGAFTFSIGERTDTQPGLVARLLAANHPSRAAEIWLGVGRWLSYAGLILGLGGLVALAICAPAALRERRTVRWITVGALAGVVGTAWMIAAQSHLQVGHWARPSGWDDVVSTNAGRWWLVRLALFAVAAALSPLLRRVRADNAGGAIATLMAIALVVVVALGGHGITGRWVPLALAMTAAHLAAMATWAGGLVSLVLVGPERRLAAATRFSPLALACVLTLATTGVVMAWRQGGSLGELVGSDYGTWLIVKLAFVAVVLLVAMQTRRVVVRGADEARPRRRLARLVAGEVAVMVLVLGATAGLVQSAPPRLVAVGPESRTTVSGDRIAQVTMDPAVAGGTTVHVYLTSSAGTLEQPSDITVRASLPSHDIADLDLTGQLSNAGPGHLTGGHVVLPLAGDWTITITARYSEFDSTTFELQFVVR
jgi:copper transport protein